MTIGRRHWLAALAFALVAHGTLVLTLWKPAESGAANLGVGGLEISFGAAGGAPGANEVSAPETEPVEPRETETAEPPETQPAENVETVETVEATEPPPPEPPEPPEPEIAEVVPVKKVQPRFEAIKPPKKPEPPKQVVAREPAPTSPPRETAEAQPVPPKKTQPASLAGAGGKSDTQETANVGSGTDTASGGLPGSSTSYFALLQAWLEKHKEYPSSARRRRSQGTAVLNFTLGRDGTVRQAQIERSSGFQALDREVLAMIKRANPLPPFPEDFEQQSITLSVPVQFRLR